MVKIAVNICCWITEAVCVYVAFEANDLCVFPVIFNNWEPGLACFWCLEMRRLNQTDFYFFFKHMLSLCSLTL